MSTISASTTSTTAYKVTADTTGTLVLQTGASPTTAMTIDGSQNVTLAGNITLNNGAADGAQLSLASSGYSNWNIDNYSGNFRWYYNATEYMRLDASGNLGIGTTSPASKVHAYDTTYRQIRAQGTGGYVTVGHGSGGGVIDTSTSLVFSTSDTERARIDSSGNLLLGTTTQSGSAKFTFQQSADTTVGGIAIVATDGNGANISRLTDGGLTFRNGGAERARIDSSGTLLVGITSNSGVLTGSSSNPGFLVGPGGYFAVQKNSDACAYFSKASGYTSGSYQQFWVNGSIVGSISTGGSTTSYNTSSDYRLKENIQPMTGALAKVAALNPVTYTWKSTGEADEGFIAHELQEVCPSAVTGEKDAVDANGNPVYQGIDTSFLVATLTAAIKEQQAIIETLTNRITALEAK